MQTDVKYQGIYRGVVVNTGDPKGLNRVTLKVPQVLGDNITNWAYPVLGLAGTYKVPYGSWTSSITQTATTANTNYTIAMDSTESAYGITLVNPSSNPSGTYTSALSFKYSGTYNIQLSAQIYTTIGGTSFVTSDIWAQVNGKDVPSSVGSISVGAKNPYAIGSWNYILNINAGDKVSFVWHSNGATTYLQSQVAQTSPAIQPSTPSFAVSAQLIGDFVPAFGDSCWVMFEGGDPNFPLWLGTF